MGFCGVSFFQRPAVTSDLLAQVYMILQKQICQKCQINTQNS